MLSLNQVIQIQAVTEGNFLTFSAEQKKYQTKFYGSSSSYTKTKELNCTGTNSGS